MGRFTKTNEYDGTNCITYCNEVTVSFTATHKYQSTDISSDFIACTYCNKVTDRFTKTNEYDGTNCITYCNEVTVSFTAPHKYQSPGISSDFIACTYCNK